MENTNTNTNLESPVAADQAVAEPVKAVPAQQPLVSLETEILVSALTALLMPKLEVMVDRLLEKKLQGLVLPDHEEFDEAVVAAVVHRQEAIIEGLKDGIVSCLDINAIVESDDFSGAVESVVENMDISISVNGSARRYR